MLKNVLLAGVLLAFLTACGTVPSAPAPTKVEVICPRLPELEPLDPDVPQVSYIEMMQKWLSGSLQAPISYELLSNPADQGTNLRRQP